MDAPSTFKEFKQRCTDNGIIGWDEEIRLAWEFWYNYQLTDEERAQMEEDEDNLPY